MTAAAPAPAEWDVWVVLAMLSAVCVGALNFTVAYKTAAGWKHFRSKVWEFRVNILCLLLLEAAAGLAAAAIVVLLGVTAPEWIDEPLGWFLLGTVGPAIAAASISTFKLGSSEINLGLSVIYRPLRKLALQDVNLDFFVDRLQYNQAEETVRRRRAQDCYNRGDTTLPARIIEALRDYRVTPEIGPEDKQAIDGILAVVEQPGIAPLEQIGQLVAFLVKNGWARILDGIIGSPTDYDRQAVSAEPPPAAAALPPADSEDA